MIESPRHLPKILSVREVNQQGLRGEMRSTVSREDAKDREGAKDRGEGKRRFTIDYPDFLSE